VPRWTLFVVPLRLLPGCVDVCRFGARLTYRHSVARVTSLPSGVTGLMPFVTLIGYYLPATAAAPFGAYRPPPPTTAFRRCFCVWLQHTFCSAVIRYGSSSFRCYYVTALDGLHLPRFPVAVCWTDPLVRPFDVLDVVGPVTFIYIPHFPRLFPLQFDLTIPVLTLR